MCAVIYLRIEKEDGSISTSLVCAKTKVAPLKRLTIPRLELTAALMLSTLVRHVKTILEQETLQVFLWTDSSVALTWINNDPARWKEYVYNRLQQIKENSPEGLWKHISGAENPADCASRGITTQQLINHQLRWQGPSWLRLPEHQWPTSTFQATQEAAKEENLALPVAAEEINGLILFLDRYSKLSNAVKVLATIKRTGKRCKNQPVPHTTVLTIRELEEARIFWIKAVQHQEFPHELQHLATGNQLPHRNYLSKLLPVLDQGILRLGGRLANARLREDETHPAIIPKNTRLVELIIREAHLKTQHGGTQLTLAYTRLRYWIIQGRRSVKAVIYHCIPCTRYRGEVAQQIMGQLPEARVTPSRPFEHTGVNYAGPIPILKWRGQNATQAGYISIFVCFSTSAMHLELVSELTTDAFIAAFRRFTSRRGLPKVMYSDQVATFIGADRLIQRFFHEHASECKDIVKSVISDGVQWKFIPPRSPHMGGKWEAAVKSTKHHLRRVIGDTNLTFEELMTLLTQIEAILHSRPIAPLTDDPTDPSALTPGHFLCGKPLLMLPEPSRLTESHIKPPRFKWVVEKTEQFWNRWYKECIQRYQSISKWTQRHPDIQGQLVLISEDGRTPSRWPLAGVIKVYKRKDGIVRVVDCKTANNILRRSIHKLCPLPDELADYQPNPQGDNLPGNSPTPSPSPEGSPSTSAQRD